MAFGFVVVVTYKNKLNSNFYINKDVKDEDGISITSIGMHIYICISMFSDASENRSDQKFKIQL